MKRHRGVGARIIALLFLCAVTSACETKTDVVARRPLATDGGADSRVPDAADTEPDTGRPGIPDTGTPDTGAPDAGDAGAPPIPHDCSAETCGALGTRNDFCTAGRPAAVVIGDGCDPDGHQHVQFAVCTCTDLITSALFEVDALDPAAPRGSASIAVNRNLRLGTETSVDGSIIVAGMYGATAEPRFTGELFVNGPESCSCAPEKFLDIPGLIAARAADNDNDAAQLTAERLDGFSTESLALDCGRYYFDRVIGSGALRIDARGRVGIFIAGEISVDGPLTLTLAPGASADIFVAGTVRVGGRLELSNGNEGNRVLFAVNGTGTIDLEDGAVVDGSIYAPRSEIVTRGPLELNGFLFVLRAAFEDTARVHYQPIPATRASCEE